MKSHFVFTIILFVCSILLTNVAAQNSISVHLPFSGTIEMPPSPSPTPTPFPEPSPTPGPSPTTIRTLDFETGDFSQISQGKLSYAYPSDKPQITNNNPYSGNYAANVSTTQTRPTTMDSYIILNAIPLDHDIYYDFEFYAPPGFNIGNNWDLLWEWYPHNSVGANEHLGVGVTNSNGVTNNLYFHFYGIQFDWNVPGADSRYDNVVVYSGVGLPTGRYVHFQILYNSDSVNGEVQVKMDGTVILDWHGKTTFSNTTYMQWGLGIYCASTTQPHWYEYDNVKITDGAPPT